MSPGREEGGSAPEEGKPGHQRGLGIIFVLSGAVYCAQMALYLAYLYGWIKGIRIGHRESLGMFRAHSAFFVLAIVLYLGLAWKRGRKLTVQDAVDASGGALVFVLLFSFTAFALAYRGANWLWSLLPGMFHLAYGIALIEGKPMFDLSRFDRSA